MAQATLTISSKNYSSWSLRGWLLCRMAGLDFNEQLSTSTTRRPTGTAAAVALGAGAAPDAQRRHGLGHAGDRRISRTRSRPRQGCCRPTRPRRAHCRAVSGEMHSGFSQSALGAADEPQGAARDLQDISGRAAGRRADQDDLDTNAWRPMAGPYLFGDR